MSLLQRKIDVTIQLGKGDFGESGFDTVTLIGHRVRCEVMRAGLPWLGTANIQIFGLAETIMNQLATLGALPMAHGRLNTITVLAGDDAFGMSQIFQGVIQNGYQDYELPDASFVIEAATGSHDLLKPTSATSYKGTVDVATVLQALASRMTPPLTFKNYGVSVQITNPYLSGTLIDQIRTVVKDANIVGEIQGNELAIWPPNGNRDVAPVIISPDTGLVGYPQIAGYQNYGVRTLFLPTVQFGQMITVQSNLQGASGNWYVGGATHTLASQDPDGPWFTELSVMSKIYVKSLPAY